MTVSTCFSYNTIRMCNYEAGSGVRKSIASNIAFYLLFVLISKFESINLEVCLSSSINFIDYKPKGVDSRDAKHFDVSLIILQVQAKESNGKKRYKIIKQILHSIISNVILQKS